ncbi:MAG: hypothetical protein NTV97_02845 [Alphaproteobacteria bacterium]|nr:hypothetical protein [Alphaproteobacteria bacterium]
MSKVIALAVLLLTLGISGAPAQADMDRGLTQREAIELWAKLDNDATNASVEVRQAGEKLHISQEAVLQLFKILRQNGILAQELDWKLALIAERHRRFLQGPPASGDAPTKISLEAWAAVAAGDYAKADALLDEAERLDLDLALRDGAATEYRSRAARTRSERGRLAMISLDYLAAATHLRIAIAFTPRADREQRGMLRWLLATVLQAQGGERGDSDALVKAIDLYRADLQERTTRERDAPKWAQRQNNLGVALVTLGRRGTGTASFEEAVEAYRLALQEIRRERAPRNWALVQRNLGIVLWLMVKRNSIGEKWRLSQPGSLGGPSVQPKDVVAAYRLALQEYTREQAPWDWAQIQRELGDILVTLGGRSLAEAVVAYRLALEEITREQQPKRWAQIQCDLAGALTELGAHEHATLGSRSSGTARLEEAVAAYRLALGEYAPKQPPKEWDSLPVAVESVRAFLVECRGRHVPRPRLIADER